MSYLEWGLLVMIILKEMASYGHERIVFSYDEGSGLRSIIAVHSTALGPAVGGLRIWPYQTEEEALFDVLRLSRGMTYKNAAMGLDYGGGKAVIMVDSNEEKTTDMIRAFGRLVESLGGSYVTGEDVGCSQEDIGVIMEETSHVIGVPGKSGNPSPVTAYGVFYAMKAAANHCWGSDDLNGKKVVVQGAGNVGLSLIEQLLEVGATVYVSDIMADKVDRAVKLGATAIEEEAVFSTEADIFAPCALGGILNDDTIPQFRAEIICGSANNQLLESKHGRMLAERGILYSPDFIVNGGGVINAAEEMASGGYNKERALAKAANIYNILLQVFALAKERDILPYEAANALAEERIAQALAKKKE